MLIIMAFAAAAPGVIGQQYGKGRNTAGPAALSVPGLEPIQGLVDGANTAVLSISLVSQGPKQTTFTVDGLAIASPDSENAILYTLSPGLPGTVDCAANSVQIDVSGLSGAIQGVRPVKISDLPAEMSLSRDSVMVRADFQPGRAGASQSTFDIRQIAIVTPDGKMSTFEIKGTVQAAYDREARRVYTVAFPELCTVADTFGAGVQNNQYNSFSTTIIETPVIMVTPPQLIPVPPDTSSPPGDPGKPGTDCPDGMHWSPEKQRCVYDAKPCQLTHEWDEDRGNCVPIHFCKQGERWDEAQQKCVPDTTICGPGQHWDPSQQKCVANACPQGQHWDEMAKQCVGNFCVAGDHWDEAQQKCVSNDVCGTDQHWDYVQRKCVPNPPPDCGPNGKYNEVTKKCEADGTCPQGTRWDGQKCVAEKACPAGTTWDPQKQTCVGDGTCPPGTYWDQNRNCISSPGANKECPAGTKLNDAGTLCVGIKSSCPAGTKYDDVAGKCVASGCPAGTKLNPGTGKCERESKVCPDGYSWNVQARKCVQGPPSIIPPEPFTTSPEIVTPKPSALPNEVSSPGPSPAPKPMPGREENLSPGKLPAGRLPIRNVTDMPGVKELTSPGANASLSPKPLEMAKPMNDAGLAARPLFNVSPPPGVTPTPSRAPNPSCPPGYYWDDLQGKCTKHPDQGVKKTCPAGSIWDEAQGKCIPDINVVKPGSPACDEGYVWDAVSKRCVPYSGGNQLFVTPPPPRKCAPGMTWDYQSKCCVPAANSGKEIPDKLLSPEKDLKTIPAVSVVPCPTPLALAKPLDTGKIGGRASLVPGSSATPYPTLLGPEAQPRKIPPDKMVPAPNNDKTVPTQLWYIPGEMEFQGKGIGVTLTPSPTPWRPPKQPDDSAFGQKKPDIKTRVHGESGGIGTGVSPAPSPTTLQLARPFNSAMAGGQPSIVPGGIKQPRYNVTPV